MNVESAARDHSRRLAGRLLDAALVILVAALVIHLWHRRLGSILEILILSGWVGAGVALALSKGPRWPRIARTFLALTCGFQLLRLWDFATPPALPAADFVTAFESAERLYQEHGNPYTVPMATSFPFPALLIFHLVGLGGRLGITTAYWVFFGVNALAIVASVFCISRLSHRDPLLKPGLPSGLLWLALLSHPGVVQGLWFGQTGILALLWVSLGLVSWQGAHRLPWVSAFFFTLAWMQKPHLILPAAFFLICLLGSAGFGTERTNSFREVKIGVWVLVWSCGIILLLLGLPGGVTLTTFRQFFARFHELQQVYAQDWASNFSLAAIGLHFAARAFDLDFSRWIEPTSLVLTMIVLMASSYLLRRSHRPLEAYLPWLSASLLPSSIAWKHYYTWIIPALYLLLRRSWGQGLDRRIALALFGSIGMLHVMTSPLFTVGLLTLFLTAHANAVLGGEAEGDPRGPAP